MANNKIYSAFESPIYFQTNAPAGSGVEFTNFNSLGNNDGAISDPRDFGDVMSRTTLFKWKGQFKCGTEGYQGACIDLYWATSNSSVDGEILLDGNIPSGNAISISQDRRRNLSYIGSISVDNSGITGPYISSGLTRVFSRYAALVVYNQSADSLSATEGDNYFIVTPVADEIQS